MNINLLAKCSERYFVRPQFSPAAVSERVSDPGPHRSEYPERGRHGEETGFSYLWMIYK